jgi:hypothetical protein
VDAFTSTASSALGSELSLNARLLVLETAASRGQHDLVSRVLSNVEASSPEDSLAFWGSPAAAVTVVLEPSLLRASGADRSHPAGLEVLVEGVLALLDAPAGSHDPSGPLSDPGYLEPLRVLPPLVEVVVTAAAALDYDVQEGQRDPQEAQLERAFLARAAESLCTPTRLCAASLQQRSLDALTALLPARSEWLKEVLPELDPTSRPEANLLARLCALDVEDGAVWGSLRWGPLASASAESASAYSVRLLEHVAARLLTPASREAFAALSPSWAGTAEDLASTCLEV